VKGNIVKSVLGYWILLFAAILTVRYLNPELDSAGMTKVIAIVTAAYVVFGFVRSKFFRKS